MKRQEKGDSTSLNGASKTVNGTQGKSKTIAKTAAKLTKPKTTVKTSAELVKQRLDKRTKLETLYKDIDQLENALTDFNKISGYGDVWVKVSCSSGHDFTTTRQDTVDVAIGAIEQSIKQKLTQAHDELAQFEF